MAKRVARALVTAVLFGCFWSQAQSVSAPGDAASQQGAKKPAPTFKAAGVQGNIAPSGYSGGAREEEARQVASLVVELQAANFADELPGGAKLSCDRQAELLHAALTQPDSFEANVRLGLFYLQHENPVLSVKYLGAAKKNRPGDSAVMRYLATADVEANDYADADRLAGQLIDANPADAGARRLKAAVEAAAGHAEAALAEYKRSATLDSGANNVFSAGVAIMALGFFEEAERMYTAGIAAHPESAKLWLGRGMTDILRENQTRAIDSLLRSAALDPTDRLAPTLLARLAESAEASALILPVVQAFAAARPGEAIAHYDYALVLLKSVHGYPDTQARERIELELKEAVREQPQFAAAHFQLGILYENTGDVRSAIAEFFQAVSLKPDVPEWHYRLSRTYRRAGQVSSAELEMGRFNQLKSLRDAGGDVSATLLDGLPPEMLGVAVAHCEPRSPESSR